MITAKLFQNNEGVNCGFEIEGHSGYSEEGSDIICAAVSALAINAMNSIESLTDASPLCNAKDGYLSCLIDDKVCPEAILLLDSLSLGLKGIEESYGTQYLHVLTIRK
jgi:uncharacterized protein YsxB (DUF464 family)